jgi:uncharacterized protein YoxC
MLKLYKDKNTKKGKKKGQSTVEYILLAAAVIGALVIFLKPGGTFHQTLNTTLDEVTGEMTDMKDQIVGTHTSTTGNATP